MKYFGVILSAWRKRRHRSPVPTVTTIDGVVQALESIVDWSVSVSSRLGYFAALYKRITIAIGSAVSQGKFEDAPRMQRLDVTFATRYFDALNGYFHPAQFAKPTSSWRVVFDAASRPEPIILQHLDGDIRTAPDLCRSDRI